MWMRAGRTNRNPASASRPRSFGGARVPLGPRRQRTEGNLPRFPSVTSLPSINDLLRLGEGGVYLFTRLVERNFRILVPQHHAFHRAVYRLVDLEQARRALDEAPVVNVLKEDVEIARLARVLDP